MFVFSFCIFKCHFIGRLSDNTVLDSTAANSHVSGGSNVLSYVAKRLVKFGAFFCSFLSHLNGDGLWIRMFKNVKTFHLYGNLKSPKLERNTIGFTQAVKIIVFIMQRNQTDVSLKHGFHSITGQFFKARKTSSVKSF